MIKHCEKCGKDFKTFPSIIKLGKGRFCSRKCSDGEKVKRTCLICGTHFEEYESRIKEQRGKFCSMPCYRKSRKGSPAWNKGIPATWMIGNKHRSGKGNPNPNKMFADENHKWKGDKVGYYGLHNWVRRNLGKPQKCEFCKDETLRPRQYHWANKSKKYLRDTKDWIRLCVKCHKNYDK